MTSPSSEAARPGYTAAIRAAQLGGKVVCIEREPALGGTCLRVGLHPDQGLGADAPTRSTTPARRSRSSASASREPQLDFAPGRRLEGRRRHADDRRRRRPVQGERRRVGAGHAAGSRARRRSRSRAREDVTFKSAIVATGSYPLRPPIPGLDSPRCVDSTGLLAQTEVPRRLVVLGGGIIGCEFASIFAHFGSEVTIIEMLPTLIPQEDADAAKELQKAFKRRGIAVHLEKQCTGVEDTGDAARRPLRRRRVGRGRSDARRGRAGAARGGPRAGRDRRPDRSARRHRDRRSHAHRRPDDLRGR